MAQAPLRCRALAPLRLAPIHGARLAWQCRGARHRLGVIECSVGRMVGSAGDCGGCAGAGRRLRLDPGPSRLSDRPGAGRFGPARHRQPLSVERTLGRPTFVSQFGEPDWYYVSIDTEQAAVPARRRPIEQTVLRGALRRRGQRRRGRSRAAWSKVAQIEPRRQQDADAGPRPQLARRPVRQYRRGRRAGMARRRRRRRRPERQLVRSLA